MEDVTFLEECGITIDSRWLAEMICQQAPEEVCNYVKGLDQNRGDVGTGRSDSMNGPDG